MAIEKEYMIALVSIGGTLLATGFGVVCTLFYDSYKEKRRVKSEIQQAINEVLHVTVMENYAVTMNALRKTMIANAHLVHNDKLGEFYDRWLNDPMIQ